MKNPTQKTPPIPTAPQNKPRPLNWALLGGSLIWFIGSLLGGAGVIWWGMDFEEQMRRWGVRQRNDLSEIRARYEESQQTLALVKQFMPPYNELKQRGFIGTDQRLNWINQFHLLESKIKLPTLRYNVSGQTPFAIPKLKNPPPDFQVYQSEMTLELGLLHEGDLLRLLDELDSPQAAGLYSVKRCELRRLAQTFSANPRQANLTGLCTLLWYTVNIEKPKRDKAE